MPQRSPATRAAAEFVEDGVEAVHFHLMHHPEELAEPALWKARAAGKPRKILNWEIVNRHTRWEMLGAEFAKRHPRLPDLSQIGGHPIAQTVFVHIAQTIFVFTPKLQRSAAGTYAAFE